MHAEFQSDSLDGFVRVLAKGAMAFLGTDDEKASFSERPRINVEFTYDYSIGRHEVLCSDFNKVMEKETGLKMECKQDSLPVANVTRFDAILFANALSKSLNRDTSYRYTSAEFDDDKHCIKLGSFDFIPEANGIRLPTESEWMLAAIQTWNPKESWNFYNSENFAHEVCSFTSSKNAPCDMSGNLLEWVNDWMGNLPARSMKNYVGPIDGGPLQSSVVKGGSYMMAPSVMSLYRRGDTYAVLAWTKANYVGFRLAYGPVPNAEWSSNGETMSSPMRVRIGRSELLSLTGARRAKLAFRNASTQNLVYVNFTSDETVAKEIPDTLNVYHPVISPDGRRVAFSTSYEGVGRDSSFIYVRDLDVKGGHLVRLESIHASIPRWKVNENGDTLIVYVSSSKLNDAEDFFDESTWQVKFSDGKFGTPEKLFDGAYNGGVSDDYRLAVTGARLLRARLGDSLSPRESGRDSIWYGKLQACNVSLATDGSDRTMFLDFGGSLGREFAGARYGVHEQLLVADKNGELIHMVPVTGDDSFDHSEWVSGVAKDGKSNLVVASLVNPSGNHWNVVLVNLGDSSIVSLVEGSDLEFPSLWVEQDSSVSSLDSVDLDSAGVYFRNDQKNTLGFSSAELAMRLQSFWSKRNDLEMISMGSSMLLDAVIEDSVKSYNALNMGVTLSDVFMFEYLLRQYILPYAPKMKVVVVELAPGLLNRDVGSFLDIMRKFSPGLQYDENHLSEETVEAIAANSLEQIYSSELASQPYIEGTNVLPIGSWGSPTVADTSDLPFESETFQKSLKVFASIKKILDERGIKLVVAITPRNPAYADSWAYGLFGPSREVAHRLIDAIADMGIEVFDENKDGKHDYGQDMAYDYSHVSYLGAQQFTARLDSLLSTIK